MKPRYQDLYFGMSDSRNEVSENRENFVKSFVDLHGASQAILEGRKFLVLGPKGTGKSALAWFLEASEMQGTHLAFVRDASSLPLAEVPRLQTGQSAGPERTVVAWKFILLCNYLELLLRDQGCSLQRNHEVMRVAKLLRDFGFMGDASGRALVKASSTTIEIPVPKMGSIYKRESKSAINIYNLIPYLESWVSSAEAEIRHVLMIDGLDSIYLNDAQYDESLSSLVQAAYSINQKLREHAASGSVVLLLRNDVSLGSRSRSQTRRRCVTICRSTWTGESCLGQVGRRLRSCSSSIRRPQKQQVLSPWIFSPTSLPTIEVGTRGNNPKQIPTFQYLLNMTRHTPRDLLRIFEEIRKVEESGVYAESRDSLSAEVIHEGVLRYSTKYFVGAISNEFAGYRGGPESASRALTALKTIGKQTFDAQEFRKALDAMDPPAESEFEQLLRLLFYAGAIGNYVAHRDESYMQFYHRRDDSEIYLKGSFVLHHALIHAWGMRRTQSRDSGPSERPRGPTTVSEEPESSANARRARGVVTLK